MLVVVLTPNIVPLMFIRAFWSLWAAFGTIVWFRTPVVAAVLKKLGTGNSTVLIDGFGKQAPGSPRFKASMARTPWTGLNSSLPI